MIVVARLTATLVITALCAVAVQRWVYTPYACSQRITELTGRSAMLSETGDTFARITRARTHIRELQSLRTRCPTDIRVYMLLAENLEILGLHEEILRTFEQALEVERRPEIHIGLGQTLIMLGRPQQAADQYLLAARFDSRLVDSIPSEEVTRIVRERLRAQR